MIYSAIGIFVREGDISLEESGGLHGLAPRRNFAPAVFSI